MLARWLVTILANNEDFFELLTNVRADNGSSVNLLQQTYFFELVFADNAQANSHILRQYFEIEVDAFISELGIQLFHIGLGEELLALMSRDFG